MESFVELDTDASQALLMLIAERVLVGCLLEQCPDSKGLVEQDLISFAVFGCPILRCVPYKGLAPGIYWSGRYSLLNFHPLSHSVYIRAATTVSGPGVVADALRQRLTGEQRGSTML